ncbi:ABC transporter permease [Actinomadura macrotermitis]|uniref:ABC transport system permease protein n=1 Tax=Actinomadura macrotermitis TaxID=2585200 RepID=A0A7K0BXP6_9ACTN|nr:FtsX-like permease family protein [Actinomadura macrotermitis]MQY05953.1 hypothetical protein [Actinomadura macrotermitis]
MLRTTLAGLLAHKLRLLLTAVAITLGVGFISGTFVLTDTMDAGVAESFARSAGKVDTAVLPPEGRDGVPAALLGRIRGVPGVTAVHGVVKGDAPLLGRDGKVVGDQATVGTSVPAGRLLRYDVTKGRVPAGPDQAVVDTKVAEREKYTVGDTVTVLDAQRRPHRFTLVGLVDFGIEPDIGMRGAVGFDPATAVAMTGAKSYHEIDVAGASPAAVAAATGGGYQVLSGKRLGERLAKSAGADTEVIQTGLLIFGLVAMLVSALVIYNTFAILIAQRTREMALLRCVGASRRQVFGGVVLEAAVVGLVGSLLGLAAGLGLGAGALALINALGARIPAEGATLTPRTVLIGLAVGVLVTVASALLPARAATRVAPIAALRSEPEPGSGRFRLGRVRIALAALFALLGIGAGVAGSLGMAKGPTAMYVVAFAGAMAFLGVIAVMPALVRPLARAAGAVPARLGGVPARLAVANAQRTPRRTATTTIALTIGVGLMTLFAVVAAGGKATADKQITKQFPVDFQIQAQYTSGTGRDRGLVPHGLTERLRGRAELASVMEIREDEAKASGRDVTLTTVTRSALGTLIKPKFTSGSLAALGPGTAVVNAETAKGRGWRMGQTVQVAAKGGTLPLRIAGIYANDLPLVGLLVPEDVFDRLTPVRDARAVFAKAADGASAAAARTAVTDAARPYPAVKVASQAEIREQMTDAIDTILMIFGGLLALAIVIALFGIANTLTLSVVERTRESALLRALGITKRQLRRMLSVEALVMAVIGAFTGVVLGVAFGWAATRSMADSAVFAVPYLQIAGFMLLAGAAGMLAAVLPARRAAKASIVESLSHD